MANSTSASERIFSTLVRLFPTTFRERFGQDMRELFRDQLREARARDGVGGVLRLWTRILPSLLRAAIIERHDSIRDTIRRARTRRRAMSQTTTRSDSVLETLANDIRFAGRMLRRSPVFTVVAVIIIS